MKAILISIQPKWCELIASGKKTVEVRKTRPKLETPFKVYIYETQGRKYPFNVKADTIAKHDDDRFLDCARGNPPIKEDKNGTPYFSYGRMKVIGEFVCDEIIELAPINRADEDIEKQTCLSRERIVEYLRGKGYGWHISNLIIYDKPKELSEFAKFDKCPYACLIDCLNCSENEHKCLTRPPQSWYYVEELEGGFPGE